MPSERAVKNQWNGMVEWNTGMTKLSYITSFSTYLHFTIAKDMFYHIVVHNYLDYFYSSTKMP